jgi:hypothetical protein
MIDGVMEGEPLVLTGALEARVVPRVALADGAVVAFVLTVLNKAGLTYSGSVATMMDNTRPLCMDVEYLVDPQLPTIAVPNADGSITIEAQVQCWDDHSSIRAITMNVGYVTTPLSYVIRRNTMCLCEVGGC